MPCILSGCLPHVGFLLPIIFILNVKLGMGWASSDNPHVINKQLVFSLNDCFTSILNFPSISGMCCLTTNIVLMMSRDMMLQKITITVDNNGTVTHYFCYIYSSQVV